jgi:hypothetical protein
MGRAGLSFVLKSKSNQNPLKVTSNCKAQKLKSERVRG